MRVWATLFLLFSVLSMALPSIAEGIDCNNNGAVDAVDILGGFSDDCNGNGVPDECELSLADSVTTETIALLGCRGAMGCRPHSGALADLDNDGDLDVFACTTVPPEALILLNDGGGTLTPNPPSPLGDLHPLSVVLGDVDGDEFVDAVIADSVGGHVFVYQNQKNGEFSTPEKYPTGRGVINVQVADIDADGDVDIVATNKGESTLSVLFNRADGKFYRKGPNIVVGLNPSATAIADFNGDQDRDIAVANRSSASVSLLLNAGEANFPDRIDTRISADPNSIEAADFDGDGDFDLVTANTEAESVSLLLNSGDGTFDVSGQFPVGAPPSSLTVVDFDGDGALDVVTANETSDAVSLLYGRGDATFAPPIGVAVGEGLRWVFSGDLDGDADPDLVTLNRRGQSLTLLFNQSVVGTKADFLDRVCTRLDFYRLAATARGSGERFLKYTLPANEAAKIQQTIFQNTKRYNLHQEFLGEVFAEIFPDLSTEEYTRLVGERETRHYFVGTISEFQTELVLGYGFSVSAKFSDRDEQLSAEEVKGVFEELRESFLLEPLVYLPNSQAAIDVAEDWGEVDFPMILRRKRSTYEAYTRGVGFGYVRLMSPADFRAANNRGLLSLKDILILAESPRDMQGVVSGVITAEFQGEGSHLAVRTARRGTPNAFVKRALAVFQPFEGKLVRIEVTASEVLVEEATFREAEDFWRNIRRTVTELPQVDPTFSELASFPEIAALDGVGGGLPAAARFGSKATNLARLQSVLEGPYSQYQEKGFGIPVHYYLEFMRANRMPSALDASREVTYEEYLQELFAADEFHSDSSFRFAALERLRATMRERGRVDPVLIQRVLARIEEIFDAPATMKVRFRSSSNIEDAVEFSGAGLYDSTAVCLADEVDGDAVGPSLCDPSKSRERTISRALKKVWASLWNFRAYEERAFYTIPQELAAMGVLVSRAFDDELANGVAYTGDPTNPLDSRYVVIVQQGENSVAGPAPGMSAEKNGLEVVRGQVVNIIRETGSSLMLPGTFVLSDDELRQLGVLMWQIDQNFRVDLGAFGRQQAILDIEFKKTALGDLAVKQVRPLLVIGEAPQSPTFELLIPPGTVSCGSFDIGRTPREEYYLKSTLRFVEGSIELPSALDAFSGTLIEELLFGPQQEVALASRPGLFRVHRVETGGGEVTYSYEYEQEFTLESGAVLTVELSQLDFSTRDGEPLERTVVLDEERLIDGIFLRASLLQQGQLTAFFYSSCSYHTLPRWEVEAELEDGTRLFIDERYRIEEIKDVGPAGLRRAEVEAAAMRREVTSYWDLVYSAARHNTRVQYWVLLDPPLKLPGLKESVFGIHLIAPEPSTGVRESANYLTENLHVLEAVDVMSFDRTLVGDRRPSFRRGDVDANGEIDVTDAVLFLEYLFARGEAPRCRKAADANDDGKLNLADGIKILLQQFRGGHSMPGPFPACGTDPTEDNLSCGSSPSCEGR